MGVDEYVGLLVAVHRFSLNDSAGYRTTVLLLLVMELLASFGHGIGI